MSDVEQVTPQFGVDMVQRARDASSDIWLLATAHRDVEVSAPWHGVVLRVPPLRERGDDVLLLADHYLRRYSQAYGIPATALSPGDRADLRAYKWPGNVRELMNIMERTVILARYGMEPRDLGL